MHTSYERPCTTTQKYSHTHCTHTKNSHKKDDGLVAALIKENKENKEKLKLLSVMQKANEKLKKENEVKKEQERNLKKQNADLHIEAKNLSKQLADNKKTKEGLIASNPPLPLRVHNKKKWCT